MHLPERWGILQFEDSMETGASYYQDWASELNNQHSDSRPFTTWGIPYRNRKARSKATVFLKRFDFDA